jgi:hypothetical protein
MLDAGCYVSVCWFQLGLYRLGPLGNLGEIEVKGVTVTSCGLNGGFILLLRIEGATRLKLCDDQTIFEF